MASVTGDEKDFGQNVIKVMPENLQALSNPPEAFTRASLTSAAIVDHLRGGSVTAHCREFVVGRR
jgi:hypothetical protein